MPNPTPPQNNMMQELLQAILDMLSQLLAWLLEYLGIEQPEE